MKIETQATGSTPAHETARRASEVVETPPRDLTVDGLLKLVDKLERAHKAQAEIAWQHYQRAERAEARLDVMETAVADVLRFVSRGDWNSLRPETRVALEGRRDAPTA